uniref:Fumarylacetoacetate hydrolase domain-containing protein 2 n=1 Tax=Phallusia mammillata TaxID=59560 RepID=A0A6F9DCY3_9ASCI|nr:fumarylacetoacetate hydrolase domain-containing protein 2 [Phallusia mammillata]
MWRGASINFCRRKLSTATRVNMKLVQFVKDGKQSIGVQKDDSSIVDLTADNESFPNNMVSFLAGGSSLMEKAKSFVASCKSTISTQDVKILSPITGCEKVVCVGMNYKDHCLEQNAPIPEEPVIFSKFPSSITGDGDPIILPKLSNSVDWEVELAVVIGQTGKNIQIENAFDYVAGYTVAHDVSARDWQMQKNGKQWLLGKTFDTFCPLGPWLLTKDAVKDPHNLSLRCIVNDKVMQNSSTSQLVFGVDFVVSWISKFVTLKPGDVILTGTPPGVGIFRKPPILLKAGDVVTCEVEGIGKITNPVVEEK